MKSRVSRALAILGARGARGAQGPGSSPVPPCATWNTLSLGRGWNAEFQSGHGHGHGHGEPRGALRRGLVALLIITSGAGTARGETLTAPTDLAVAPSAAPLDGEEAILLRLQAHDLRMLVKGLEHGFRERPIEGRYDTPISSEHPFGTIGVHGLAYSFKIAALDVLPADGYLTATFRIEDVRVNVDRITFDRAQRRSCTNLPLTSAGGTIPAYADATVLVQDRRVNLSVTRQGVGLDASNFHIGRPDSCSAMWGFDWLIRRITPWFASIIRDRIKESIAEAVVDAARQSLLSLNDMLQISITLPFSARPAPAFYATISVWPAAFDVEPGRISFGMGADVAVDPDFLPRAYATDRAALGAWSDFLSGSALPTFAGIKRRFLSAVLAEANAKGLLRFRIDAHALPEAADFLTTGTIAEILPDAASRFPPETHVALVAGGAAATDIRLEPQGPGGLPILVLELRGLKLAIEAAGRPYYELTLNVDASLHAGFDTATHQLVLGLGGVTARATQHGFAPGLAPPPADSTFDEELFALLIEVLSNTIEHESGRFMAITLPNLIVGDRMLEFLGSGVREDAVTVDGRITDVTP